MEMFAADAGAAGDCGTGCLSENVGPDTADQAYCIVGRTCRARSDSSDRFSLSHAPIMMSIMTGNVSASRRAPRTWKSRLRSLLFSVAIIYGSIALMLALLQRSLIYAQTRVGTVTPRDGGSLAGRIHPLIVTTHDQ